MKLKPSDLALEAKKRYIPYITQRLPELAPSSFVHSNPDKVDRSCRDGTKLRVAVIHGDPVDVALDWFEEETKSSDNSFSSNESCPPNGIPVVNMANERCAGGDWESGLLAPEENLCRRSNLVKCLTTPWKVGNTKSTNYPVPSKGGIYSPNVVVFRGGPDQGHAIWPEFKSLPVISVAPIRRPKLDASGKDYSFAQEKELMKEKIRIVLRIAVEWDHRDLCVGAFGAGPFRNPVHQLARMWKDVLFTESEFKGVFRSIVFAIDSKDSPEYEAFAHELDASNIFKTTFR